MGRRDYAILSLLAKLGLRADEVATLMLDDIDWRASEILVRAKGRQRARMPKTPDVGAAIVAYLRNGRATRLILSASGTDGKRACKALDAAPDPRWPDRTRPPDSDPPRHCAGLHG
jgi:integrase